MDPRKQKEQFSIAYVRAVAAVAGVGVSHIEVDDDSVDVMLVRSGGISPKLDLQLKCTAEHPDANARVSFPLKLKNYEDLSRAVLVPRLLVVLFVPEAPADWMNITAEQTILRYHARWLSLAGMQETTNDTNVTVHLPAGNLFTPAIVTQRLDAQERGFRPV
jgi:hypothetical protein